MVFGAVKVGLVMAVTLASLTVPQVAEAQYPKGQNCGVIVHKERVPGGVSTEPWVVWAKGLSCDRARKVAKAVAKSSNFMAPGWQCVNKSVQTSRIVCTTSGQRVELVWGH